MRITADLYWNVLPKGETLGEGKKTERLITELLFCCNSRLLSLRDNQVLSREQTAVLDTSLSMIIMLA